MLTRILSVPASKKDKYSLLVRISQDQVWWTVMSFCQEAKFHNPLIEDEVSNPSVKNWENSPQLKNPAPQEIQVLARRESAGSTKEAIASLTPSGEERLEQLGGRERGRKLQGRGRGAPEASVPRIENLFHLCFSPGRNKERLTGHASLNSLSSWPVWLRVMVGQPVCLPAHTPLALLTHSIDPANKFRLATTLSQFQAVASEV